MVVTTHARSHPSARRRSSYQLAELTAEHEAQPPFAICGWRQRTRSSSSPKWTLAVLPSVLVKISGIAEQGQRPESVGYERWAMDVTHIPCGRDGWGHLVVVIDCHDCEIVAYEFALRGRDSQLPRTPMNSHPPQGAHAMGTLVVKLGPPTLKGGRARSRTGPALGGR